ncbi:OsmC family protein [Caulobacter sp. S45]|uniref:OsmC family protein n=1 Tax=Caulobacter sp. S45 TaxID=1641861 RepID=UPI001575606E|nr:OsmC family protein [Caulobacter sp. S45]
MPPSSMDPPQAVRITETRAGRYQVRVQAGGASFLADEPMALGGLGSGPNPYDLLGAALGSCTAMTLRLYADRKGWPLSRVEVAVSHRRDAKAGRDVFERDVSLEGGLDDAQAARLMEIADRCPVHQTLQQGAEVRTRLVPVPIHEAQGAAGQHMRDMDTACAERG